MKISVLGLGIIGSVWAKNLLEDGHEVRSWNRTPKDFPGFHPSVGNAIEGADAIIIVVADPAAVQSVLDQIISKLQPGQLVIQSSTISAEWTLEFARQVGETGAAFLEAPFTGSKPAAEQRQTVFYLGGDPDVVEQSRPVLEPLSNTIQHIGPLGSASTLKLAMNLNLANMAQALCESITLCRAAGISDDTYFSVTITPDAGKSISLTSISFDAMAGTAGPSDRQFYLMSDKTGYLSTAVLATASTVTGSPLVPYNTSTFDQNFSADLSGNSALSNITDSVTFRFYIATPTTFQNVGFDDITVKGIIDDITAEIGDVSIAVEGASAILGWEAYSFASYSVQTNLDLPGESWGPTYSNLTGVSGTMWITNAIPDATTLFYRVILESP